MIPMPVTPSQSPNRSDTVTQPVNNAQRLPPPASSPCPSAACSTTTSSISTATPPSSGSPRPHALRRSLRRLRLPDPLRRLPRPGLRRHRQPSRLRPLLHVRAPRPRACKLDKLRSCPLSNILKSNAPPKSSANPAASWTRTATLSQTRPSSSKSSQSPRKIMIAGRTSGRIYSPLLRHRLSPPFCGRRTTTRSNMS